MAYHSFLVEPISCHAWNKDRTRECSLLQGWPLKLGLVGTSWGQWGDKSSETALRGGVQSESTSWASMLKASACSWNGVKN